MSSESIFNLLPPDDLSDKLSRLRSLMQRDGISALFIDDNANKYYLSGRVFSGYILITTDRAYWFVRRPTHFSGENIFTIRKVENIAEIIDVASLGKIAFELTLSPYAAVERYAAAFGVSEFSNADNVLNEARSVKTDYEISLIRRSSDALTSVYRHVPRLYRPGMTDVELQIEIERDSRLRGCLGIFRISGSEMELNMGSVLAGDNADNPSPYDFAMGGAGFDPSLPVGADGTVIRNGMSVMVDTNGNFTGYMTDMTRTFACGSVSDEAQRAHRLSIDICRTLADMGRPGVPAADLYKKAIEMAAAAGLAHRFMGHRSQAGFVGHGLGITINELPVLAPRSRDVLQLNNVIAIEPKFVIEGVGAVGIENTYVVRPDGMECLTSAPEQMVEFIAD